MTQQSKAYQSVVIAACVVVIIAGLMAAKSIVVPLLLAGFIAIIAAPLLFTLQDKGLSNGLALSVVLFLIGLSLVFVTVLIGSSISSFSQALPVYEGKLTTQFNDFVVWLKTFGITLQQESVKSMVNPASIMKVTGSVFQSFTSLLTDGMMILFLVIFMLLEATVFPQKLHAIHIDVVGHTNKFLHNVKHYMVLKTSFSLLTGVLVTIMMVVLGVQYAILWGFIAFLLNFIPNIGSIVAAIPAVLLALIQLGSTTALIVAVGFVVINVVIGSIIEPKYMGEGLGLSTLVVFISLIFWGWILGPAGMLLSIPLTVMCKIALEINPNTQWIAILMDSKVLTKQEVVL